MPRVAHDAFASISINSQQEMLSSVDDLENWLGKDKAQSEIARIRADIKLHLKQMGEIYRTLTSCIAVNCWHRSDHESEAMWNLYSKSGVAIKTTVRSIKNSLAANSQPYTVQVGAIKYMDFLDPNLSPQDCVTPDGHLMGMIKRLAYAHEREVRMSISDIGDPKKILGLKPSPKLLDIDPLELIDELVISPFASIPMKNSILAVSKIYSLPSERISQSQLLENCEFLLKSYSEQ